LETKVITPYGRDFRTLRIYFKSLETERNIRVRIFNLHNKEVIKLDIQNMGNRYLAEWDGRDQNNQIKQGIYIYQIEIRGKAYNGTFVIAK